MSLLVLNWKMNPPTFAEARGLFEETKRIALRTRTAQLVLAPPSVFLHALASSYRGKRIAFAAQDVFYEKAGSYTGSISALQAKEVGATYSIIGHSEMRAKGDTDEIVQKKVHAALAQKLQPIICVGEYDRDKDAQYITFVRTQLRIALANVPASKLKDITIAYEPLYAIGAATPPTAHAVHELLLIIKKELVRMYGAAAEKSTLIYGGAVSPETAPGLLEVPEIKGFILGRASLQPEAMHAIVKAL